jgi:hypothetical protein
MPRAILRNSDDVRVSIFSTAHLIVTMVSVSSGHSRVLTMSNIAGSLGRAH